MSTTENRWVRVTSKNARLLRDGDLVCRSVAGGTAVFGVVNAACDPGANDGVFPVRGLGVAQVSLWRVHDFGVVVVQVQVPPGDDRAWETVTVHEPWDASIPDPFPDALVEMLDAHREILGRPANVEFVAWISDDLDPMFPCAVSPSSLQSWWRSNRASPPPVLFIGPLGTSVGPAVWHTIDPVTKQVEVSSALGHGELFRKLAAKAEPKPATAPPPEEPITVENIGTMKPGDVVRQGEHRATLSGFPGVNPDGWTVLPSYDGAIYWHPVHRPGWIVSRAKEQIAAPGVSSVEVPGPRIDTAPHGTGGGGGGGWFGTPVFCGTRKWVKIVNIGTPPEDTEHEKSGTCPCGYSGQMPMSRLTTLAGVTDHVCPKCGEGLRQKRIRKFRDAFGEAMKQHASGTYLGADEWE